MFTILFSLTLKTGSTRRTEIANRLAVFHGQSDFYVLTPFIKVDFSAGSLRRLGALKKCVFQFYDNSILVCSIIIRCQDQTMYIKKIVLPIKTTTQYCFCVGQVYLIFQFTKHLYVCLHVCTYIYTKLFVQFI